MREMKLIEESELYHSVSKFNELTGLDIKTGNTTFLLTLSDIQKIVSKLIHDVNVTGGPGVKKLGMLVDVAAIVMAIAEWFEFPPLKPGEDLLWRIRGAIVHFHLDHRQLASPVIVSQPLQFPSGRNLRLQRRSVCQLR